MVQVIIKNKKKVFPVALDTRRKITEAEEILCVLDRAAVEDDFIARLTDYGSKALKDYHLSQQAIAALVSGDIRWIEDRVGKLAPRLCTWLDCRLQQEIW